MLLNTEIVYKSIEYISKKFKNIEKYIDCRFMVVCNPSGKSDKRFVATKSTH